jgi:hydrogenase maturation factor
MTPSLTIKPGKLPGTMLEDLIARYRTPADPSVIVEASYGFDAAAISIGNETLIVKSDPITFATEGAANYLVAVNANDIACMGGIPRWMTVVALLPETATTRELVESLFADLQTACIAAGVTLLGGHTEITLGVDRPLLIGTMLGTAGPSGLLTPGKATAGNELYLTKTIGIEGTALLAHEKADDLRRALGGERLARARRLTQTPGISIVRDARVALATGVVTALHDPTEGGLATAIHEMAEASSLGARIDAGAIPVLHETRLIADHYDIDPLGLLSSGALLLAARPGSAPVLQAAFRDSGIPITRIGDLIDPEVGKVLVRDGDTYPLPRYDADELTRVL